MITDYVKNNQPKNVNNLKRCVGSNVLYLLMEQIKRKDVIKK